MLGGVCVCVYGIEAVVEAETACVWRGRVISGEAYIGEQEQMCHTISYHISHRDVLLVNRNRTYMYSDTTDGRTDVPERTIFFLSFFLPPAFARGGHIHISLHVVNTVWASTAFARKCGNESESAWKFRNTVDMVPHF